MTTSYGSIAVHHTELESEAPLDETPRRKSMWKFGTPVALALGGVIVWHWRYSSLSTSAARKNIQTHQTASHVEFPPRHFDGAIVDHHSNDNTATFTQRYYEKSDHFKGPGSPIFLIFGGEDPLDGPLYPFIYDHLAHEFGGYTVALEHRFYGESTPVQNPTHDELHKLLSPNQALWDAVTFIQHKRKELGCSLEKTSKLYCPVVSVGGSYPGFLSALMRFVHSDIVDISYASSAPFNLYSHHVDQYAYYDKVTETADQASPGCAAEVREALSEAQRDIVASSDAHLKHIAEKYGVCRDSVPAYIQTTEVFARELMLIIVTHFANGNMDYYPPGPQQDFVKGCYIFQNPDLEAPQSKIAAYLLMGDDESDCFDMMTELPPGPMGRISASDWSGVGSGPEGFFWDYQSCQLIPECGFSKQSMFPPRRWTLEGLTDHCMARFDWAPDPQALNREFGFDDRSRVQRLLLTNGIVDGWSIASVLEESEDAPGVKVVNMVNGAHHSDLSHQGPSNNDTPDVKEAFIRIKSIIGEWLDEVRSENST